MNCVNDARVVGNSEAASPSLVPHIDQDTIVHDRSWWRLEAARLGTDWPGVLASHAAVVVACRRRHDRDGGTA
jgi:hypothetical protein